MCCDIYACYNKYDILIIEEMLNHCLTNNVDGHHSAPLQLLFPFSESQFFLSPTLASSRINCALCKFPGSFYAFFSLLLCYVDLLTHSMPSGGQGYRTLASQPDSSEVCLAEDLMREE